MCPFYRSCLRAWSKFTCVTPVTENEIASQCLWNNSYIKCDPPRVFIDNMISHEVLCVGHLFEKQGNIKLLNNIFDTSTKSSMYQKCCFHWLYVCIATEPPPERVYIDKTLDIDPTTPNIKICTTHNKITQP